MYISVSELEKISLMKYRELCSYLKQKYGDIIEPYFSNNNCKTVNQKIKRTSEGLFIHHIAENQSIELSNPLLAKNAPFEYQLGENLVYCNYWEHMFLHICIVKEYLTSEFVRKTKMAVGIGGLVNFILPEIIDYINGYEYKRDYMRTALSVIDGHEDFFIKTLFNIQKLINKVKYDEIMFGTFKKTPDVFKGKMTHGGRFFELVSKYSFDQKLFKYNELSTVYSFIDSLVQKGITDISFGFYKEYQGDTCSAYIVYYGKRGAFNSRNFKLYPRDIDKEINNYIEKAILKDNIH